MYAWWGTYWISNEVVLGILKDVKMGDIFKMGFLKKLLHKNEDPIRRYELHAISAGKEKDQGHIEVFENVKQAKAYCEKGKWDFAAIRDRSTGQAVWYWSCPSTEKKWRWMTAREFDSRFPK